MFRKMKQNKLLPTQEKFDTLIGATTEIYGRLVLLDSVRIDGKVVGNIETAKDKKVTVGYNPKKISLDEIRKIISETGYDADDLKANPKSVEKLPACCKPGGMKK